MQSKTNRTWSGFWFWNLKNRSETFRRWLLLFNDRKCVKKHQLPCLNVEDANPVHTITPAIIIPCSIHTTSAAIGTVIGKARWQEESTAKAYIISSILKDMRVGVRFKQHHRTKKLIKKNVCYVCFLPLFFSILIKRKCGNTYFQRQLVKKNERKKKPT